VLLHRRVSACSAGADPTATSHARVGDVERVSTGSLVAIGCAVSLMLSAI